MILGSFAIFCALIGCQSGKKDVASKEEQVNHSEMKGKYLFTGTYTKKEGHVDGKASGLVISQIAADHTIIPVYTEQGVVNPSYLTISYDGVYMYVVNETGPDVDTVGSVSAFRIDKASGNTKLINSQPSYGFAPCYITTDSQNRLALITNYVGGTVVIYPIGKDGSLGMASQVIQLEGNGPDESRQEASHPHSINLSPDGKYAYVADLGTDRIMIYRMDYDSKKLIPAETAYVRVAPGSGPRHMTFDRKAQFAYVISEMGNTITVFSYDSENGNLHQLQVISTLPEDFEGDSWTADIHISVNEKYLYGSNRGHNSIVGYEIKSDGTLTLGGFTSTRGEFPRSFLIDGSDLYVANQNTGNIVLFSILEDGSLQFVKEHASATPVCLKVYSY